MRIVPCVLVIAFLSLGGNGCSLFNKKPKEDRPAPAAPSKGGKEPARFPGSGDPIREGTTNTSEYGGLIAGSVIDKYNNHPKEAYIRWVCLDDSKKEEAPIDVAVSPEGYFTIRNLKANSNYKLLARAKDGSKMLAGVTYVKTPNIHVLIRMSEDMVTADTPPVPGPPAYTPKSEEAPKKTTGSRGDSPASAQTPSWAPANPGNASLGNGNLGNPPDLPAPVSIPAPVSPVSAPAPSAGGWVPGIAATNPAWPPRAEIPPPQRKEPASTIDRPIPLPVPPPPSPSFPPKMDASPARVPSCVLVGKQLINFALYDLNRQPWEFRTSRQGKLVLLDFWGTMCIPCKETIPHLRILQSQYGPSGLEVVGIAYESESSFQDQARRVQSVAQRLQTNYRLLLGGGGQCPVRTQFNVRYIPTLVLLDENGWILWRHEGRLDRSQLEELELILNRRLGAR